MKIKLLGFTHRSSLVSPCQSFSLSPTHFIFHLVPWSIEAPFIHLSAQFFNACTGRHSASSLPRETGRRPEATVNNANFFSQSFIGSLCKPRNMSLFLSSIFLSTTLYPYLSLNQLPTPNHFELPCMQQGWTMAGIPFLKKQRNVPSS